MPGAIVRIGGKIVPSVTSVLNTATAIPATSATGRISLIVTNEGSNTVYIGDSTVTAGPAGNGTPLEPSEKLSFDIKQEVVLYGRTVSGTSNVKSLEGV